MFNFLHQKSKDERSRDSHTERLEKTIRKNSRWQMLWSGVGTAVLSTVILSVGQPLWEITVIHPITLAKLKQDMELQVQKEKEFEERLDTTEKLLSTINYQVQELLRMLRGAGR